MKRMRNMYFFTIFFLSVLFTVGCIAQEPTRWRGPDANGIYPDKGLLKEWPAEGPEIIWSFEKLGKGHSSPVIQGEYLYTTGMIGKDGYLFKFDLDGNLIYKKQYGPEYWQSWSGTRGSTVIVDGRVYLVSGHGHLHCLKESDGSSIWKKDLVNDYGGDTITWGYNETVVIDGDVLYCTPGGKKNNVIALDRHTGKIKWSCPGKGDLSAYCSPLLFNHGGRKILATHTSSNLVGIDAETGKMLWSQSQTNRHAVHANTPIYHEGSLFYFSGYGRGAGRLDLNDDGSKVSLVWKNETFDNRMGGAMLLNGYIYGSGDQYREWKCLDWETGKTLYTSTDISKGNVIYADGMLYCYSERGELALVNPTPEKFDLVSKTTVEKGSEQHWAHPVIHRGVLYLRHGKALIAYRIK